MPAMATEMAVSTFASAKVPVMEEILMETTSLFSIPTRAALVVSRGATVVPLYTLLLALTPETVSALVVMLAVVVGWVSE